MRSALQHRESSLVYAAEQFLGSKVHPLGWLEGGEEALVLRVETKLGMAVLHVSPAWRSPAELSWVHRLARQAQNQIPEVVAPIEREGRTMFEWAGQLVTVYPFVPGHFLDRDDPALRADAARLLAAIHRVLLDFSVGTRPESGVHRPRPSTTPDLRDPDLDTWWNSTRSKGLIVGPTHGDYYRRNLLCTNRRIIGIIDWHEASVRPLALELAQATFELCRNDDHVLQFDRANEFIASYRLAGGPIPTHDLNLLLPLMRIWIRDDIRRSLVYGSDPSDEYVTKQMRAFYELSSCKWVPGT